MASLSFSLPIFFSMALSLCMLWVVLSDASRYIISNALNGFILGLYVPAAYLLPLDAVSGLTAAAAMLAVGFGLFSLGVMGGGDIKLLVVLSFWTGWNMVTLQFIFLTAIFGGALVVVVLLARLILPGVWQKLRASRPLPRLLTKKQPVPYGIAIAGAFSWLLWTGQVAGLS